MIGHDEQEKKALRAENVLLVSDNVELQGQLHEQQALSVRLQETVDDLQKQIIEIKCTGCAYRSARRGNLKMHMLTHTGKKPYKCTICGYRAIHAGHLNQHMRTHTGEKPFKCTSCGYRAVQASNLKQHMRTHTGEKPFKSSTGFKFETTHAHPHGAIQTFQPKLMEEASGQVEAIQGRPFSLSCKFFASPLAKVAWESPVLKGADYSMRVDQFGHRMAYVLPSYEGEYKCTGTNKYGSASGNIKLVVRKPTKLDHVDNARLGVVGWLGPGASRQDWGAGDWEVTCLTAPPDFWRVPGLGEGWWRDRFPGVSTPRQRPAVGGRAGGADWRSGLNSRPAVNCSNLRLVAFGRRQKEAISEREAKLGKGRRAE
ncbi:hypothetical protein GPALN_003777 [Globodera pallida]|nr:hypothetical protein GPALN_003777 [Globodera pallida]